MGWWSESKKKGVGDGGRGSADQGEEIIHGAAFQSY